VRGASVSGRVSGGGRNRAGTVVAVDGQTPRLVETDADGRFATPPALPPGEFAVTARRPGFASGAARVRLEVGGMANVQLSMARGRRVDPGALRGPTIGRAGRTGRPPTTFLTRGLKPVANRPRMPARTEQVDLSPSGRQVVALTRPTIDCRGEPGMVRCRNPTVLSFYAKRGGRRRGRVELGFFPDTVVLSWIRRDRLLVLGYTGRGSETTVAVVNPRRLRARRHTVPGVLKDASRAGGSQLVLTAPEPTSGPDRVLVLDANGRVAHTIPAADAAGLRDNLVLSSGLRGSTTVSEIDPAAGRVVASHRVNTDGGYVDWLPGTAPGLPIASSSDAHYYLDPESFAVTRIVHAPGATGIGAGLVTASGHRASRYDEYGRRIWTSPKTADYPIAFGRRVYLVATNICGASKSVAILSKRSGKVLRVRRGRFELLKPTAGSTDTLNTLKRYDDDAYDC